MEKPVKYGVAHVMRTLGIESTDELFIHCQTNDCPSVCRSCGMVYESGHEPDACRYDCEDCDGNGTVNSVLVLMGVI